MRIGPLELANSLVLAPMAGVTDRPFRVLCRGLGAGLAVSEMVTADTSLYARPKTVRRLDHRGEPGPVSVQIVGADPRALALAARVNADRGAQIIDVNMGCPAKKVCRVAAGSALLRDEPLVGRILEAVVRAVDVPVTLKMRTGWDPERRNGVRVARIAEASGVAALAVHGRTRACGFAGRAEYETVAAIKRAVSIPVIANGDIDSPRKAREVWRLTGADGLMIGRAARGRPWIFRQVAHCLRTGAEPQEPPLARVRDTLARHLEAIYEFYGPDLGVRIARKHIGWYSGSRPGGAEFRARINRTTTTDHQREEVERYFDRLTTREELAA
jgi:tRNA-dihydrouridine synthase B